MNTPKKALGIPHPLQSPEWASFRKAWGNEVKKTKFGYLPLHKFLPEPKALASRWPFPNKIGMFIKGPVPSQEMLDELKKIATIYNLIFIKLEPNIAFSDSGMQYAVSSKQKSKLIKLLEKNGCVRGKTLFTPTTFWIDLAKSEEELLKSFSGKTRYNIRLAERKGVKIVEENSDK